jgi:hypothetical protein
LSFCQVSTELSFQILENSLGNKEINLNFWLRCQLKRLLRCQKLFKDKFHFRFSPSRTSVLSLRIQRDLFSINSSSQWNRSFSHFFWLSATFPTWLVHGVQIAMAMLSAEHARVQAATSKILWVVWSDAVNILQWSVLNALNALELSATAIPGSRKKPSDSTRAAAELLEMNIELWIKNANENKKIELIFLRS